MDSVSKNWIAGGAVASVAAGALSGYRAHREASEAIGAETDKLNAAIAAQKKGPNEAAIRKKVNDVYKGKVPADMFEDAVKGQMQIKQSALDGAVNLANFSLKSTKDLYKHAARKAAISTAIFTAFAVGTLSVVTRAIKAAKNTSKVEVNIERKQ